MAFFCCLSDFVFIAVTSSTTCSSNNARIQPRLPCLTEWRTTRSRNESWSIHLDAFAPNCKPNTESGIFRWKRRECAAAGHRAAGGTQYKKSNTTRTPDHTG